MGYLNDTLKILKNSDDQEAYDNLIKFKQKIEDYIKNQEKGIDNSLLYHDESTDPELKELNDEIRHFVKSAKNILTW